MGEVNSLPKGLLIVNRVLDELHILSEEYDLNILNNTIINITEALKEVYSEDVTEFRVLTSDIGLLISGFFEPTTKTSKKEMGYVISVFSDNNISKLDQVNLSDIFGLFGIDLTKFTYLSKCTFHFNKLYRIDQLNMMPSIKYRYVTSGKKE